MENGKALLSVNKTKGRIGNIDIAKAVAIFFVCWLHIAKNSIPTTLEKLLVI